MIRKVLKIGRWVTDFIFAEDGYDEEAVLGILYDIDASIPVMRRFNKIMESGDYDRGFTFTNPALRRAIVVIGPTSSSEEFLNTFTHEVRHLANAIAKSIGYSLDEEGPSYLTGDLVMSLARVVCHLGCDHCRDDR